MYIIVLGKLSDYTWVSGNGDADASDKRVTRESEVTACGQRRLCSTREPGEGKAAGEGIPNHGPATHKNILSDALDQGTCC